MSISYSLRERLTPRQSDWLRKSLATAEPPITNEQMAVELGVTANAVGNYLAGRTRPPRSVLVAWALRTGVPVAYLEWGVIPEGDREPVDSSGPNEGHAALAQSAEQFTRNDEWQVAA